MHGYISTLMLQLASKSFSTNGYIFVSIDATTPSGWISYLTFLSLSEKTWKPQSELLKESIKTFENSSTSSSLSSSFIGSSACWYDKEGVSGTRAASKKKRLSTLLREGFKSVWKFPNTNPFHTFLVSKGVFKTLPLPLCKRRYLLYFGILLLLVIGWLLKDVWLNTNVQKRQTCSFCLFNINAIIISLILWSSSAVWFLVLGMRASITVRFLVRVLLSLHQVFLSFARPGHQGQDGSSEQSRLHVPEGSIDWNGLQSVDT